MSDSEWLAHLQEWRIACNEAALRHSVEEGLIDGYGVHDRAFRAGASWADLKAQSELYAKDRQIRMLRDALIECYQYVQKLQPDLPEGGYSYPWEYLKAGDAIAATEGIEE